MKSLHDYKGEFKAARRRYRRSGSYCDLRHSIECYQALVTTERQARMQRLYLDATDHLLSCDELARLRDL